MILFILIIIYWYLHFGRLANVGQIISPQAPASPPRRRSHCQIRTTRKTLISVQSQKIWMLSMLKSCWYCSLFQDVLHYIYFTDPCWNLLAVFFNCGTNPLLRGWWHKCCIHLLTCNDDPDSGSLMFKKTGVLMCFAYLENDMSISGIVVVLHYMQIER